MKTSEYGYLTKESALAHSRARLEGIRKDSRYPADYIQGWEATARYYDFGPDDLMTGWSAEIVVPYVILERDKPSKPWRKVGECKGSCQSDANDAAGIDMHSKTRKVMVAHDWPALQARQHLRAVGIKA